MTERSRRISQLFRDLRKQEVDDAEFQKVVEQFVEDEIETGQSEARRGRTNVNEIRDESNQETILHVAVQRGFEESVEFLLPKGADVQASDEYGITVVHQLAMKKEDIEKGKRLIEALLKHADINAADKSGNSPLWLAVDHGNLPMVEYLLERERIDVEKENQAGDHPLHAAVKGNYENTEKIVRALLEHGASPALPNKEGDTPLHTAGMKQANYNVLKALLSKSTDALKMKNNKGETPIHVAQWTNPKCSKVLDLLSNPDKHLAQAEAASSCAAQPTQEVQPFRGSPVVADHSVDRAPLPTARCDNGGPNAKVVHNHYNYVTNLNLQSGCAAIGNNPVVNLPYCGHPRHERQADGQAIVGLGVCSDGDPGQQALQQNSTASAAPIDSIPSVLRCNSDPQGDSGNLRSPNEPTYKVTVAGTAATTAIGDNNRIYTSSPSRPSPSGSTPGTSSPQVSEDESASAETCSTSSCTPPTHEQVQRK